MPIMQSRRRFLTTTACAGASAIIRPSALMAAEGALETTTVRILKFPAVCVGPQYIAEELLRAEGFTEIRYVDAWESGLFSDQVGRGEADFTLEFAAKIVQTIDAGGAVTALGGVHVGCYELFAKDEIRSLADLKGKTVGIQIAGGSPHAFLTAIAAHVGLDPKQASIG